jgi:hypothetical protein
MAERDEATERPSDEMTLQEAARWMASTMTDVLTGRIAPREANRRAREVGRALNRFETGR